MLTELTNVLAYLYPDESSIRRIIAATKINVARVLLHSSPLNNWHSILVEADKVNQVVDLLEVVKEEYGDNCKFQHAYCTYLRSQPQAALPPECIALAKPPQTPVAFDWIQIAAGDFRLGLASTDGVDADECEMPPSSLYLPDFWIARTTVTVTQFTQFVKATGYLTTAEVLGKSYVATGARFQWVQGAYWAQPQGPGSNIEQKGDHPVTCLSWYDTLAFCQWAGVRLPSEAEWEKAARGADGKLYPWGNGQPDRTRCNFNATVRDTMPVGSFPEGASPYQLLDMAGNVWEWTRSLWGTEGTMAHFRYPYSPTDGREDLQAPATFLRVARGGSWDSRATAVRATFRGRFDPKWSCNHIGFRVAWFPVT